MFIANLAPILVVLSAVPVSGIDKTSVLQNAMFIAGIGTIIQLYPIWKFGGRLPIVVGVSFTFVGMLIYVGVNYGYGTMIGSLIIGGIFITIMGLFAKYWKRFIKPVVSSLVVLGIGLSLLSVGGDYFAGGSGTTNTVFSYCSWQSLTVGAITFITCLLFQLFIKGSWKNLATLFGIVVGYIVSLFFNIASPGAIDFSAFNGIKVFSLPRIYNFGEIRFNIGAILPVCLIFLVASTEGIGDVTATCKEGLGREPTDKEISGAISCDGLVSTASACFGCLPLTTFSQNVGIVGQTKVVNRFTILLGAFILIIAGLFPPIAAAIQTIPYPVLGGALTMLFASIVVTGIKMFAELGFTPKNILILTIALGVGYGFSLVPNFYSGLGPIAENILSNPVAMIFILALILSFAIPEKWGIAAKKEEKVEETPPENNE
ncbi:MAG: purine/pyrimidine permease [Bacilli bacterium]|nr:purine/pyrimidine permease [Bacilli bacterium]